MIAILALPAVWSGRDAVDIREAGLGASAWRRTRSLGSPNHAVALPGDTATLRSQHRDLKWKGQVRVSLASLCIGSEAFAPFSWGLLVAAGSLERWLAAAGSTTINRDPGNPFRPSRERGETASPGHPKDSKGPGAGPRLPSTAARRAVRTRGASGLAQTLAVGAAW